MKKIIFLIICFGLGWLNNDTLADNSACPELPYLASEYAKVHAEKINTICVIGSSLDNNCYKIANIAKDKFDTCFSDCGGNDPDFLESKCGNPYDSSLLDCYWYECTTKIDNDCAEKCKDYLLFEYNSLNKNKDDNSENLNDTLIGSPINLNNNLSPCVGSTPKNSKLCPGDDEEIFYYTEKQLVDVCSIPKGSEPKCEYICKTEYLDNGTCKEEGFFRKILNWLGGLF
jgi:hypothetical protein